jgi:hypothetical protein
VVREVTLPFDHARVERELRRGRARVSVTRRARRGSGCDRHLVAAGVDSVIVAPGLVPSRPGDRVKTDKRDARRLAALHAGGLLTAIFVPAPELEALRDLVRAREDARLDRMRARHRLGKFCLRHDRRMPTTCWGVTRRAWLGRQAFELPGQQQAFDDYLFAVDQIDRRIGALEAEIARIAADGPHTELIGRLRCLRGIDTLTAVGLVCEVGDFTRFKTAEQFMSFVGLVPSERSSGEGPPAARRIGLEQPPATDRRLRARAPPPWPRPTGPRARVALPTASASPLAADAGSRQAPSEDRRRLCPRARRVRLGDRHRPADQDPLNPGTSVGWRAIPPRRRTLATPMRHPARPGDPRR